MSKTPFEPPAESSAPSVTPVDHGQDDAGLKWNQGISNYQWLVLVVASLGWVFDIFEGQIFVASMRDAMPQLLGVSSADNVLVDRWNNYALASFLLGARSGEFCLAWSAIASVVPAP